MAPRDALVSSYRCCPDLPSFSRHLSVTRSRPSFVQWRFLAFSVFFSLGNFFRTFFFHPVLERPAFFPKPCSLVKCPHHGERPLVFSRAPRNRRPSDVGTPISFPFIEFRRPTKV